jgi:class 3 adenylate cyclase/tetratricopeptide (TPR) repeat protein
MERRKEGRVVSSSVGPQSMDADTSCPSCGASNPADARFCGACGAALTVPGASQARKTVTVVFTDIVGSTTLGHGFDPEALREMLGRYFAEMKRVVERHGGAVEKFVGDAVMAVFGVPQVHEDDALRAVRAAAEMRAALAAVNEELERMWGVAITTRTGVNTGEILVEARRREAGYGMLLGDPVNVAARLEQTAEPGEILLGAATYRLVRDAVIAEELEPLALKGKPDRVRAWRLVEVAPGPAGLPRGIDSGLVGRAGELAALEASFARVSDRSSCELVTVVGPAGVGKSRLAQELTARIGDRATVLEGRCLPYGEGITFWPVAALIRMAAAIEERDTPAEARDRIDALLRGVGDDAPLVTDRLAALLGLGPEPAGIPETFWAVRRLLEHLAADRPLVAVLEDLHWAEPTFLDLVAYLAQHIGGVPVMLLCLARADLLELRPDWPGDGTASIITPAPLTDAETDALLRNLVGGAELGPSVRRRIAAVAEGNPLFVEETLKMLVDDGVVHRREDAWIVDREIAEIPIPSTINALLAARLDRLEAGERTVIERASIIGRSVWWAALRELCADCAEAEFGERVQALVRKQLLRPDTSEIRGEEGFQFAHILVRDAAYRGIPKTVRADLHEALATWMETHFSDRAGEYAEITGYHLEQAYLSRRDVGGSPRGLDELGRRAAASLGTAGQRAFVRGDMPAAVNLLSRAAALLPASDRARVELLPNLAFALMETGDFERLQAVVAETASAAAAVGDAGLEAHATILGLWIRLFTDPEGWADEAQREATGAIFAFEDVGDHRGLAKAWSLLGLVHIMATQFTRAEDAWRRAAGHAHRAGDRRDELESLSWVPLTIWAGPTPAGEAIPRCDEISRAADGDRKAMASALFSRAVFEAGLGRTEEARSLLAAARTMLEEVALPVWISGPLAQFSGWSELLAGEPAAAEQVLRAGAATLQDIGEVSWLSSLLGILAEAVYAQGRHDEAWDLLDRCREAGAEDDIYSSILLQSIRAKLLAHRGAADEAEALGRSAVVLAGTTDFAHLRWHALESLADVLEVLGRPDAAAPVLEDAIRVAEAKGNRVGAERGRAHLAALRAAADTRV